jgi:hypothetical protein
MSSKSNTGFFSSIRSAFSRRPLTEDEKQNRSDLKTVKSYNPRQISRYINPSDPRYDLSMGNLTTLLKKNKTLTLSKIEELGEKSRLESVMRQHKSLFERVIEKSVPKRRISSQYAKKRNTRSRSKTVKKRTVKSQYAKKRNTRSKTYKA